MQLVKEHSVTVVSAPEPLWTDPGINSGINVRELISTSKKKKKAQAGNELSNILKNNIKNQTKISNARKNPPPAQPQHHALSTKD